MVREKSVLLKEAAFQKAVRIYEFQNSMRV